MEKPDALHCSPLKCAGKTFTFFVLSGSKFLSQLATYPFAKVPIPFRRVVLGGGWCSQLEFYNGIVTSFWSVLSVHEDFY